MLNRREARRAVREGKQLIHTPTGEVGRGLEVARNGGNPSPEVRFLMESGSELWVDAAYLSAASTIV